MSAAVSSASAATHDPMRHTLMANAIRALSMDAVEAVKSGHPGMPMGMADVATVLFSRFLSYDPGHPEWPDRDRFILSAGHGSMLLYALLHLTGYEDVTVAEIRNFRQLDSRTAGHPEYGHAAGIETTTGPLGQGLANAVGMALAERILNARFGDDLVAHYTYVVAGDGCLMEGISHEAISLAGHLGLGRLIVLFDDNGISIDGPTDLSVSDDQLARFRASNWDVTAVDGHDAGAIAAAIDAARRSPQPSLIACRTRIAYGAPTKAGTAAAHGAPLGADEIAGARETLDWPHPPFEIPDQIRSWWLEAGARGTAAYAAWTRRVEEADAERRGEFERIQAEDLPHGWKEKLTAFKDEIAVAQPKQATRQSSGAVLDILSECIPELLGGSADLTGSNNTKAKNQSVVTRDSYDGQYIFYGVREHGMAAAMNGIALHRGLIPYGGTFLIFADYCRPSIRLSALMGVRVIYVMTHDSIGLGEDGPTHQPVEHLASLRAIPNLDVYRPADAIETAECWELALESRNTPSVLALTRQGVPTLRGVDGAQNLSARGAYILRASEGEPRVTLVATGSEVEIAVTAWAMLQADNIPTRVVSAPCLEAFARQDAAYRSSVLGEDSVRVCVEAGVRQGWDAIIGDDGAFVGMHGFGASAPAADLYRHFGITAEAVADAAREKL
ncbi:MAG: transketolase [Alphaproteobacteria bacterium]|nr:transketolase [Alphaproteobacteria bacterium]